nr:hypothetical protein [Tanacetum cinerariifolium]
MGFSVASHKEEGSSSNTTPTVPVFDLPAEIVETYGDLNFEKRAKLCYKTFLTILLKNHGLCIKGLSFHPDYPYLNIFHIHDLWRFPKEALCFFYYLFKSFTIGITFNAEKLLSYVIKSQYKDVPPTPNIYLLCYNETSDDDDDARSLWSSNDDEHFDPFKDDLTYPDARWRIHMITPIDQEPAQEVKHIRWDVFNCESFLDEAAKIDDDDDEDLLRKRNRTKHDWKIKNPTTIGPTGYANTISPAEATLNWQSENAVAQNKVLGKILSQQNKKRSQALIQDLNQVEPVDVSDLESLYPLDDEPSDLVLFTIAYSDLSFDDDSDTDSLEDVNPIKASHPGMNPDHYQLAKEECEQLVSQGIIEPTTSTWATDDKFPFPQKKSLFQNMADARVLFKFDLKSRFWQLAFQKATITIFEKILANTLVNIDDILLFSSDEQSHAELLSKFYSLVTKYRIMLSEKKIEVGVTTIQFLGMEIFDGKYQPQPHVAQELLKFLDELSSQKMIQQFLGQTKAVKAIKSLAEKMPPLKIHASSEKRILQTDASDECWGAVLLVQDNNN